MKYILCVRVCPCFEWVMAKTCMGMHARTHTHAHRLGWAYYRTSDLQLLSPGIGTWLCVFILFAAGRTDDSSCASLPTRAALLPSNTDQIAVARRRVKCTLKPFISVLLFFFAVFDQCIILLVNTRCSLLYLFNLSTYSVWVCVCIKLCTLAAVISNVVKLYYKWVLGLSHFQP